MKTRFNRYNVAALCCAMFGFSACSDWTDVESIEIKTPGLEEQNPELYARYISNLNEYKKSAHKVVYAWFDNENKQPFSRGQHLSDVPDSLDVVVMKYPQNLAAFELEDMTAVRAKGTRVIYEISFEKIRKAYLEGVDAGTMTNTFDEYLKSAVKEQLGYADPFDGMVVSFRGSNPLYMSDQDKADMQTWQNLFFGDIMEWQKNAEGKLLAFRGYPENLMGQKALLDACKHIMLATESVKAKDELSVTARLSMLSADVPTDRFLVVASTVSLDSGDKNTGFYGDVRALSEAAYWTTESAQGYVRAGLAIEEVQNDYYNPGDTYRYVREAIQIMNPAPKKY